MTPRTQAAAREMESERLPDWKRSYSIDEACAATSYGETTIWRALRVGKLKAKQDGKKILILRDELDRYLANLPDYIPASLKVVK